MTLGVTDLDLKKKLGTHYKAIKITPYTDIVKQHKRYNKGWQGSNEYEVHQKYWSHFYYFEGVTVGFEGSSYSTENRCDLVVKPYKSLYLRIEADSQVRTYYVLFLEKLDTNVLELEKYGFQLDGRLKETVDLQELMRSVV